VGTTEKVRRSKGIVLRTHTLKMRYTFKELTFQFKVHLKYILPHLVIFLRSSYAFPSIIRMINSRRMRLAGHVARMGEKRNVYRIWVGKPERKRRLGRPRRRWADNIKMYLRERG
jgi:hypothetical protein